MMLFDFSMVFLYIGITQFQPPLTILFLPVFMILVFLLSLGISLPLSILGIKLKDLNYIWMLITSVIVFLTPIFWELESMASNIQTILQYSPWVRLISMSQEAVIYGKMPDLLILSYVTIFIFSVLIVGIFIFQKFENKIIEDL